MRQFLDAVAVFGKPSVGQFLGFGIEQDLQVLL